MFACNISWYILGNEDKVWLKSNDQAMLRWICGVKTSDRLSMDSLYKCLGIAPYNITEMKETKMLGHVTHSDDCINQCLNLDLIGQCSKGQPCKTWYVI